MASKTSLIFSALFFTQCVLAAQCWQGMQCTGPEQAAFPGDWEKHMFSPTSRTVSPTTILNADNTFHSKYEGGSSLSGNGAILIYDFGQEVGGLVTVNYSAVGSGTLGLAFSEALNFTGTSSDSSDGSYHVDGALYATVSQTDHGSYTMPIDKLRGGFRHLTLFVDKVDSSSGDDLSITFESITVEIAYQPAWQNLRAYQGYFYSNDDLLNKIWYSGAFTLQTNAIPTNTGRVLLGNGWENNLDLNLGTTYPTIYVDGSKRDRTVWAGDLAIAIPSLLVSTGDIDGAKNTIQVLLNDQQGSGELPFAGPGLNIFGSDTYHMATMIGTYEYYLFTKDDAFLSANWAKYQSAMSFITAKIDNTGMLDVTGTSDWGRRTPGGHNSEANMLLYKVLTSGAMLATWMNDSSLSKTWLALSVTLKAAVNSPSNTWDVTARSYKNSDRDGSIYPQDANSMALVFGVADPSTAASISDRLTTNWGPVGAVAPELPGNLIGFGQSFEVKGHIAAGQATRGLDLMRLAWGWYLNNPYGTQSTCIEGYLNDGSFGYQYPFSYGNDSSYTSHAHGWSTGPTDALTTYIVGLQLTAPGGSTWSIAPQFGDLKSAEGGFTTPMGQFQTGWSINSAGYQVSWNTPSGTTGTLVLPIDASRSVTVQVDGQSVEAPAPINGAITISASGGNHMATVVYGGVGLAKIQMDSRAAKSFGPRTVAVWSLLLSSLGYRQLR